MSQPHYLSPVAVEHALDDYYGDQQKYLDETNAEDEAAKQKKAEKDSPETNETEDH